MATNNTSSSNPRAEQMGDVLDALSASPKPQPENPSSSPNTWFQRSRPNLPASY